MSAPRVAVVGLGQMGSAMAARLRERGVDVLGWDVDPAVRVRVAAEGVPVAVSPAHALEGRDFVLSSLPNAAAVRAAWLGVDGIVALASPGAVCIDASTIEPAAMKDVADAAQLRGLAALDCPVSGGPAEARAGTLIVMAGGEPAVIERARPVLEALGPTLHPTGGIGTAKVVKIVNNMMAMGNLLVACEAFSLGEAAGVDPDTLFAVLAESGGRSQTFTKRFPHALRDDYAPRFKLELAEKDLALGLALAGTEGLQLPAATLVRELFGRALQEGYRGQDAVALLAMYREHALRRGDPCPSA